MISVEVRADFSIADMLVGQSAVVREIDLSNYSTRMVSMGLLPGKTIKLLRKQPFNGSIYLELNHHFLGIRIEEAKLIKIDLLT